MSKPKVSIIVSNFDGIKLNLLIDCINSLMNPGYKNWELIVVDNASTDDSIDYLKKRFKRYKNCFIVQNPINVYSQGLNLATKRATGKYLAFFNNDVKISKKYFENLIKELEEDNSIAITQGKLLNFSNPKKIDSVGETMDIFGNPKTIGYVEIDKGQYSEIVDILSASGSACVIRKDVFIRLGGYDSIYEIGYEDMDLALRARRMGYKIKSIPSAIAYHKRGATDLVDYIKIKVKWNFNKNRLITMIKNYSWSLLIITLPVTIVIYFLVILYEWLIKRNWMLGWVRLTALIWVILNLPKILNSRNRLYSLGLKDLSNNDYRLFSSQSIFSTIRHSVSMKW